MVFNKSSRLLKCSYGFKLGSQDIKPVRNYCYLGIQFSLNGSFKQAIEELRKKALRAFFSIKRTINTTALTTSTMLKLMDCLIKPVATYGCPVWLHTTNIMKTVVSSREGMSLPKAAPKDALETTHLRILKWIMGVHRKANNNFCYGDTGRTPWTVSVIPQCVNYYHRASLAVIGNVNTVLHHTFHFQEQKQLNLSWYSNWSKVIDDSTKALPVLSPAIASCRHIGNQFIEQWASDLQKQSKMAFYCSVKTEFAEEAYLKLPNKTHRNNIAKMRSSSHDLRIEKGRYTTSKANKALKSCRYCCDADLLDGLEELPFFECPILESEEHAMTECPGYHHIRSKLSENLKSLLMLKAFRTIMLSPHLPEFGKFITDCYYLRNPKRKLHK